MLNIYKHNKYKDIERVIQLALTNVFLELKF